MHPRSTSPNLLVFISITQLHQLTTKLFGVTILLISRFTVKPSVALNSFVDLSNFVKGP